MECLHSKEHPKAVDLLCQGWVILCHWRSAGAWVWFSSDSGGLSAAIVGYWHTNPSWASGKPAQEHSAVASLRQGKTEREKTSAEKYKPAKTRREEDKMGTAAPSCSGGTKCRIEREQWHAKHRHARGASGSETHTPPYPVCFCKHGVKRALVHEMLHDRLFLGADTS